ncbi:MAG: PstS family phosphate ABC transporter substrate-binding protein [Leptolyngbyaceae cyanobacterium]
MFANKVKFAGASVALATTIGLLAVSSSQSQAQDGLISIDGSSTVFPITEAMAEEFMSDNSGINIVVGVSGTGGGFRKFCAGETSISNASRPIKDEEIEACAENGIEPIEVLVGTDALTVVVPQDSTVFTGSNPNITLEELNTIWSPEAEGSVTRWNQVDSSWPNAPISLFGPGTDSGTFDFFTDEVNGEEGASRADYTASEDDNIIVLGVQRNPNAMGYFGLSYFLENEDTLKALSVDGVAPTPENAKNGDYALARPLFIYINPSELDRPEVEAFVNYYLETARDTTLVTAVGYVPLTEDEYNEEIDKL